MTLIRAKTVFAAKTETTPGTAIALAAADCAFNAYNFELQPDITMTERLGQNGAGRLASVPAGLKGTATFRTEIGYDGTNVPTWASVLLPACGLVNNGSGVFAPKLEPPGTNVKTLTIGKYLNGKFRSLAGCMGTFVMTLTAGEMGYIDWTFTGTWQGSESDVAIPSNIDYPSDGPLRVSGGATTYDSVALCMKTMTFDIANNVVGLECFNSATNLTGFEYFLVTDRNPMVTGDPLSRLVATQNRMNQFLTSTEAALAISIAAPSSSTIALAVPKAQIVRITEADREGLAIDQIEWQCNKNGDTSEQEFSISFT